MVVGHGRVFGVRRVSVNRWGYFAGAILVGVALLFFLRGSRGGGWAEMPLRAIFYPAQNAVHALSNRVSDLWSGYLLLVDARKESDRLRGEMGLLQEENRRLKEATQRTTRLQVLLDYKTASPMRLTAAEVVGREPTHWYQTLLLNRGEDEGVRPDMGVVTPDGVAGVVLKTLPHHAQVLLLTDRHAAVAAVVQRTRDGGIVEGLGTETAAGMFRVKYLPLSSEVAVGDLLVTSGLEGSFAAGIPIGHVTHVARKEGEMFLEVTAAPTAHFSKLEEVFIISDTGVAPTPEIPAPVPQ